MRKLQILLAIFTLLALAACGGGGASGIGGGGGGFSTATLNSQLNYATSPSDTASSALVTPGGVAGVLAVSEGVSTRAGLQSVKVRTSPDYQTAYVSINGGPEFALSANGSIGAATSTGGPYGPVGASANYIGLTNLADYSMLARTEGTSGGFGYAGIATPPGSLPASLTYTGNWTGYLYPNAASPSATFGGGTGPMSLTLDVASSNMDGTFSGDLNVGSSGGSNVYPISGTVDTTLSGSIFSGTMTATTGSYTGASDLAGVFFGDNAETAAGAFGGALNGPSGTHAFLGIFDLN